MKRALLGLLFVFVCFIPSLSFAKGVPLFFQTGDEMFEIEGAPTFDEGYSAGYVCKRFGLFGADLWTWDCTIMAVNSKEFSASDLDPEVKVEMESKYSLSDRKRTSWNHYGFAGIALFLVGHIARKLS